MAGNPSILFNSIPGSGVVAPLFAFEVNSGGGYTSNSRLLLIGHKIQTTGTVLTAGTAVNNIPIFVGAQGDADTLFGKGSMLREMFRIARQNAPVQEIWALPLPETGTAQTLTLTLAAGVAPGTAGVFTIDIHGERLQIPVATTDTNTSVAANLAAAINSYYNMLTNATLPFTAAAAAGVVTLTANHAGVIYGGEDPTYYPTKSDGVIGNFATTTLVTVAVATAGAGIPTLTTGLSALADDQFDMMCSPWSDSGSLAAYAALLSDASGRWAYARQSYGHMLTVSTGATSAQTTLGLSMNDRHQTIVPRLPGSQTGTPHPPWLWAAGFAARVIPWLGDYSTGNVSRAHTGLIVAGLSPPRDRTSWWVYATNNTFVQSGISAWTGDVYGNVNIQKLVTTYQKGAGGQNDATFRDIQAMFQITQSLRYIRAALAAQHTNKGIADVNPGGLGSICTVKDIKATIVGAANDLTRFGLLEKTDFGQIVVQRNATTPQRVDVMMPLSRVKPLDVIAANATFYNGAVPKAA